MRPITAAALMHMSFTPKRQHVPIPSSYTSYTGCQPPRCPAARPACRPKLVGPVPPRLPPRPFLVFLLCLCLYIFDTHLGLVGNIPFVSGVKTGHGIPETTCHVDGMMRKTKYDTLAHVKWNGNKHNTSCSVAFLSVCPWRQPTYIVFWTPATIDLPPPPPSFSLTQTPHQISKSARLINTSRTGYHLIIFRDPSMPRLSPPLRPERLLPPHHPHHRLDLAPQV